MEGHGHLRDLARKDAEKWSLVRVPSCSNWPTSLEGHAKRRSGQAWAQRMPWDSYPAALAWPRAPASEPSSAGQEACRGLTRRDMEITSSHPGPSPDLSHLPWQPASPQVPSGGRWPCLLLPGESWSGLLFTSVCGLCSRCTPTTQSIPAAGRLPAPGIASQQTQEGSRAGTPIPRLCTLVTPGCKPSPDSPTLVQPSAKGHFHSFLLTSVLH